LKYFVSLPFHLLLDTCMKNFFSVFTIQSKDICCNYGSSGRSSMLREKSHWPFFILDVGSLYFFFHQKTRQTLLSKFTLVLSFQTFIIQLLSHRVYDLCVMCLKYFTSLKRNWIFFSLIFWVSWISFCNVVERLFLKNFVLLTFWFIHAENKINSLFINFLAKEICWKSRKTTYQSWKIYR
jgi:hypothetical protein